MEKVKVPKEIVLETPKELNPTDKKESVKEDKISDAPKIKYPVENKPKILKNKDSEYIEELREYERKERKIDRTNKIIFRIIGLLILTIFVVASIGFVQVYKNKDSGADVNVNNNFEIPVNTTNNYEHTIINNNTIIINLDNDILKEIANNLTNEIRENLNISS